MGDRRVGIFANGAAPSGLFACCVASLGLYWAWTFFSFNPPAPTAFPIAPLHVTSMAGASVSFLAIALGWRRVRSLCARRGLLLACGLVASLATPLSMLGCFPLWAALAGSALSGAAIAVLVCANAEAFSHLTPGGLLAGTALVFMIAYMMLLVLAGLAGLGGGGLAVAVACALPVATAALLAVGCAGASSGCVGAAAQGRAEGCAGARELACELAKLPWRTFCVIACMYFAIGSIRVYVERVTGTLGMNMACVAAGIVLLALALVASLFAERRGAASLGVVYKAVMPLVAMAYVVLLTAGESQPTALSVIAQTACLVVEYLCWVLIVDSSRVKGASALLVIGIGRFVVHLGMSLGELVTGACIDQIAPLGAFTVLLLVGSFVFLFSERETRVQTDVADAEGAAGGGAALDDGGAGAGTSSPAADGEGRVPTPASQAERLVRTWGLTQREETILGLWTTSHGLRSICESLGLSESTVKTHLRHIYEKSGVHSRAELIKLLDDQPASAPSGR